MKKKETGSHMWNNDNWIFSIMKHENDRLLYEYDDKSYRLYIKIDYKAKSKQSKSDD